MQLINNSILLLENNNFLLTLVLPKNTFMKNTIDLYSFIVISYLISL